MHERSNIIQLVTNKPLYYPGDSVAGAVIIHNEKPIKCKDVVVTLRNLVWVCSGGGDHRLEEDTTHCESISFREAGFVPDRVILPGVNEFTFLFRPVGGEGTISTCHFPSCGSRWVLDATVQTSALRSQLTQQATIHVMSTSNSPTPVNLFSEHRTRNSTPSIMRVPVSARMEIEKTSYKPGDKVKVEIIIENASNRDLQGATLSLTRKLTGKRHLHGTDLDLEQVKSPSGIQKNSTLHFTTTLEIPDDVVRSCKNDMLNISYWLMLKVPKPGMHRTLKTRLECAGSIAALEVVVIHDKMFVFLDEITAPVCSCGFYGSL
ncbi:hypothetical protein PROFUN_03174 [Planoprotostelium fungivorum]|uniref:Arrestin C-terminal-like domain-containing protein n=1 Tax=Planoprotostelium fungivorum TaxID=1890364 RepID=A0A2P6NWX3_9EUKA|nr:hypothetical protein PROFUN_03174 [Planoprotostelium fungivorum]